MFSPALSVTTEEIAGENRHLLIVKLLQ